MNFIHFLSGRFQTKWKPGSVIAATMLARTAFSQVLTNESFSINSGAGGSGGAQTSCMIMSDGTSWSGGAVGVQGAASINNLGGTSLAANITFKFNIGSATDALNAAYGVTGWAISNLTLKVQYTLYANNSRFNSGPGTFDIYWVANDSWVQGTVNPIFATNAATLSTWSGGQSLLASETYNWTTPGYTGTTNDLFTSVWTTDKTGNRQATNTYALGLDSSLVNDILSASSLSNSNISFYLMTSSNTLGMIIFTGGGNVLPALRFDIIAVPPSFAAGPSNQLEVAGGAVNLSAAAVGTAPLSYQWYFNSNAISGATATNYSLTSVDATNAGGYRVVVTNLYGSVTSSVAALTVVFPPSIAVQPSDLIVATGGVGSFSVTAAGTDPLSYQWYFNSNAISGATATNYNLSGLTATNAGAYAVVVTNLYGCVTSCVAALTVILPPPVLTGLVTNGDGTVTISVSGVPSVTYRIETTTNLVIQAWEAIGTNVAGPDGNWDFIDTSAAHHRYRFYRASSVATEP